MDLWKCTSFGGPLSSTMVPSVFSNKGPSTIEYETQEISANRLGGGEVDIDIREIYFLIMHFLSAGPCQRTFGQLQNELFEHQLLPRRYHAWFSRSGVNSGCEEDDGTSFPLNYNNLVERYPHVQKDHLVRLMKQLMLTICSPLHGKLGVLGAADVPTLLGTGSFSLLDSDRTTVKKPAKALPAYLVWPHMQADQVRGLSLREIGGGFRKHHRAPSIHSACYAIAKPSMMVQRMQNVKKLRGHRVAVYCAIFDRSGRHVITGSDDRLVKIWSMETAFCLASCRGHEGDITDLAVSSNNALVASSSNDFVIRVWRLPDGMPISVLRGHSGAVTAIAFSPRPSSVYQLLSSSDDGTCRIWDARSSQCTPRIYLPKPPDAVAGKSTAPSNSELPSGVSQQSHQILCCAYNANGTVFVTGSSDTYARVWNACKSNTEDPEQPVHEMDVLSGHENDVNYVQFSGCSVASRSSISDTLKEENVPKFKNSWFCHDNIVTCSRDGSAIIWVPRLRRSHGKGSRWIRAYHLKVPPPPLPPQPPRGGPRQRILPTPRGVNMIVWSLDNRFVLAAIMDCRICVWNAADGSLVHSLTGHSESSYVLDVHPFNPRIAMSAGYDGKAIVWDIWEGTPMRVYEIGRVKLVDGKFSPDGTSIVLSDDFGQIHLLNTGQGESQKDAKYDQFFLGDYRPLIRDANGNVLDQESQLPPHRRNVQDPLCDSSMLPYPEPYQSMYQQRRLGALGIDWRPPTMRFAVGLDFSLGQDYQVPPLADLERMMEPLPEFIDAMFWEPENEILTDDNDSEYNVGEEYSSEGEKCSLSAGFSSDPECSDSFRRSGRNKRSNEFEVATSLGRRVRKRNLDECEGSNSRINRNKKSKSRKKGPKRQSSRANTLRPQRIAARNALTMFSQYSGTSSDGEDEDFSSNSSSEPDPVLPNLDIRRSGTGSKNLQLEYGDGKQNARPVELAESQSNTGNRKRLVLKFSLRDSKRALSSEDIKLEADGANSSSRPSQEAGENKNSCTAAAGDLHLSRSENRNIFNSEGLSGNAGNEKNENEIRWGDVKVRSSMRSKLDVASSTVQTEDENCVTRDEELPAADASKNHGITKVDEHASPVDGCISSSKGPHSLIEHQSEDNPAPVQEDPPQKATILRFKTKGLSKLKLTTVEGSTVEEEEQGQKFVVSRAKSTDRLSSGEPVDHMSNVAISVDNSRSEHHEIDSEDDDIETDYPEADAVRRKRSMKMKATSREPERVNLRFKFKGHETPGTSKSLKTSGKTYDKNLLDGPLSSSKLTRRSKSDRNKRDAIYDSELDIANRRNPRVSGKQSWLMLSEHEMGYRYIPQLGDEVVYLRQGHEEFIRSSYLSEAGPWTLFRGVNLSAVEVCKVEDLEYSTSAGSGESCCKLTLRLISRTSGAFGKAFKLTLPELINFPDFLVEKMLYDNSIRRNWTLRDKCLVWWRDENSTGGDWWPGRIVSVQAKSPEFPDSPWERYDVRYNTDASENHLHSPWELHDPDMPWDHPHIDLAIRDELLSLLAKLEQSIWKNEDYYGFQKLNEVAGKEDFYNRFPVAIYPNLLRQRLVNNYYRTMEAMKHDIKVMLSNAAAYFASNAELSAKMRRLSDWFERKIVKLQSS